MFGAAANEHKITWQPPRFIVDGQLNYVWFMIIHHSSLINSTISRDLYTELIQLVQVQNFINRRTHVPRTITFALIYGFVWCHSSALIFRYTVSGIDYSKNVKMNGI